MDAKDQLIEVFSKGAWVSPMQISFWSVRTSAVILLSATGVVPLLAGAIWIGIDLYVTWKTCQKLGENVIYSRFAETLVEELQF